jgi:hypothetical protein
LTSVVGDARTIVLEQRIRTEVAQAQGRGAIGSP